MSIQDIRYAFRCLRRTPIVTAAAIISLALAIGANAAVFSLINAVILRPLPVHNPQQLVAISTMSPENQRELLSLSMFEGIVGRQEIFSGMFVWSGGSVVTYEANKAKYAAGVDVVNGDYYSTLGVKPLLGRLIAAHDIDLKAGVSAPVAVLDYACWQNRFNGDPEVVGKTIRIEDRVFNIIGVTPPGFRGLILDYASDATVPFGLSNGKIRSDHKNLHYEVMARLKPNIAVERARAELQALWPAVLQTAMPETLGPAERKRFLAHRIALESTATGVSYLRQRQSHSLMVLMSLVALVLLTACVNFANLMLARTEARRREIAIRAALGAGIWRLIRQSFIESVLLSGSAGALGLIFAFWATGFLLRLAPSGGLVPYAIDPGPDLRVLSFTVIIALLGGLLFGVLPASRMRRFVTADILQQDSRSVHGGNQRFGKLLVSFQMAFCLVLIFSATLLMWSLQNMRSVDPGFHRKGILSMLLSPQPGRREIANRSLYYRDLSSKLAQLPAVESVSYSYIGPVARYEYPSPVSVAGSSDSPSQAIEEMAGPGLFHTLGMRLLDGRDFDWHDDENAPRVAIISESLARQLFPRDSAIGRKAELLSRPVRTEVEIVGIVNSASLWIVKTHEPMAVYTPPMQEPGYDSPTVNIHIAGNAAAVASSAERIIESMGNHFSLRTQTLQNLAERALIEDRMVSTLATFFGGLGLLLALIGLNGLLSFAVTRKIPEIGIRVALGAQPRVILSAVLLEAMWPVFIGVGFGVPGAMLSFRFISKMVFGVTSTNPSVLAYSTTILVGGSLLAAYLPARRASRIDPVVALRTD
jgi:predicted permease